MKITHIDLGKSKPKEGTFVLVSDAPINKKVSQKLEEIRKRNGDNTRIEILGSAITVHEMYPPYNFAEHLEKLLTRAEKEVAEEKQRQKRDKETSGSEQEQELERISKTLKRPIR